MYSNLLLLADISYHVGLIGLSEYEERLKVAAWLADGLEKDPRDDGTSEHSVGGVEHEVSVTPATSERSVGAVGGDGPDPSIRLLVLGHWVFTKGDRDCYPSVPHGHFGAKSK